MKTTKPNWEKAFDKLGGKTIDELRAEKKSWKPAYCNKCIQMTNHKNGKCLKCKIIKEKARWCACGGEKMDESEFCKDCI